MGKALLAFVPEDRFEEILDQMELVAVGLTRSPTALPSVAALNLAVHRSMVSIDDVIERYGPPVRHTADASSSEIGHRSPS